MKRFFKIFIPILLSLTIIGCSIWYLFEYDREFTRDILLTWARRSENNGNHTLATWFYNKAYAHDGNSDAVAIELAQQYIDNDNYTKAEYTLTNAISDGGGIDVYLKLCQVYIEQDKLYDAVNMLNNISNPTIKMQLDEMRPEAPTISPEPGEYHEYITATVQSSETKLYVTADGTFPSAIDSAYTGPIALVDGENIISAVAVNDAGLVSPLARTHYLIGGVVEKVTFVDAAVEARVRELLNVTSTKDLYTNDLWTIKEFTMPDGAKKYEDLRHMIYLERLTIVNGIADQLSFIENLNYLQAVTIISTTVSQDELKLIGTRPVLKELILEDTKIASITHLKETTGLVKLDISDNSIANLEALRNMTELVELDLHNNAVYDLSVLSNHKKLQILDISNNQISTLGPLCNITSLTFIRASYNIINDLADIGKLTKLTELYLDNNQIATITSIGGCTNMQQLNLEKNLLTDISEISSMTKLMHLDISDNQITALPAFSSDCPLVTIDGSFNQISSLEELRGLPSLNTVNMQANTEIKSVEPLANCPNLYYVNVLDTKVTEVTVLTDQSISVIFRHAELKDD